GTRVELEPIADAWRRLSAEADVGLVEGAGGLLVPLGGGRTRAGLAARLDLPILIVARPSLGTVNHTLLTVEAARRRGLRVVGVIFSRTAETEGPDERSNPDTVARYGDVPILGTLPRLAAGADPSAIASESIDIS